jgi:hypothetical protein
VNTVNFTKTICAWPFHVAGKIVRLWTTEARRGLHYQVEYEYHAPPGVDGQLFRNQTQLPQERFERLKVGGPIAVKVCRTAPANHQIVGEGPRVFSSTAATLFNLGALAVLVLGGVINLWWWWISHRQPGAPQVVVLCAGVTPK